MRLGFPAIPGEVAAFKAIANATHVSQKDIEMLKLFSVCLAWGVMLCTSVAFADVVVDTVTIKEVDQDQGSLLVTLPNGEEQTLLAQGDATKGLAAIKVGSRMRLEFDSGLSVVTQIIGPDVARGGEPEPLDPKELNAAALKRLFAGRAIYDKRTRQLTIAYDFRNKKDLEDFDVGTARAAIQQGVLRVWPADSITHKAVFESMTVQAKITIETRNETDVNAPKKLVVATTGGLAVHCAAGAGGPDRNGTIVSLRANNAPISETCVERFKCPVVNSPLHLEALVTAPGKVFLRFGAMEMAGNTGLKTAGSLILGGQEGGVRFSQLVISGKPDFAWVSEMLAKPREKKK